MERTPLVNLKHWLKGQMLNRVYGMLTCREFEEFVQAYHDDELTEKQLRMFNLHMRVCEECRDYVASYQRSIEISAAVLGEQNEPVPDTVPADLIQAILEEKSQ